MKLCCLEIGNKVVCEVVADYPPPFGVTPRLNRGWLRNVLAEAIRVYFAERNQQKYGVVKA